MIRKATSIDIEFILLLTKACAKNMIKNGIFQWNEHYPNAEAFEQDIARNELYVLTNQNTIVGTIVMSSFMDEEYQSVHWLTPNTKNLYIHRLAVHPDYQGCGFAQQLMSFAEHFGKENKYLSIRLDTFSQNDRNQRFYELRGYQRLGSIYFPKQSEHPFYCYERIL
ncbi:ribosomal protein S18 acetylase RimI-like enzyme [Gelidibacter algens]|jgi:ribosomal protein S18 acetylase RimI-like enzyme|uniref:Ribosomal protein S18 acetylase RimI-like enzyme n=1 Tax=Gelidibacter algens TaxID=49280 RepID=A0A1A7R7H6_9FLAO|nr:GNAT family N-acetyltransferase [Gelidibacter algens]OBX26697.1 GNAT family acetyltransferase [Gelidibacter algens]RAJ25762.1 ribosomal protein S18 acetylase RimI-like enzyme [Gelidibacter algens]